MNSNGIRNSFMVLESLMNYLNFDNCMTNTDLHLHGLPRKTILLLSSIVVVIVSDVNFSFLNVLDVSIKR